MNRLNYSLGFQAAKNPPTNSEDMRDRGSIPGSGRSPGGGNDYSLQYSCLETPMDRGAWRATVHGVGSDSIMCWPGAGPVFPSNVKRRLFLCLIALAFYSLELKDLLKALEL